MEYLWTSYGIPMDFVWSTYGIPMEQHASNAPTTDWALAEIAGRGRKGDAKATVPPRGFGWARDRPLESTFPDEPARRARALNRSAYFGGAGSAVAAASDFSSSFLSNSLTRRISSGSCCNAIICRLAWRSGCAGVQSHFSPSGMLVITPDWAATETRLPILRCPAMPTWPPRIT